MFRKIDDHESLLWTTWLHVGKFYSEWWWIFYFAALILLTMLISILIDKAGTLVIDRMTGKLKKRCLRFDEWYLSIGKDGTEQQRGLE